ncbi:hypothetical protein Syun_030937 [Stephania yunnanensis]|uniref:Chaoptin n=1 Tax=Stephania yunnanensis TaxID=152371 RepID=A0AAP0DVN3_9MAGN
MVGSLSPHIGNLSFLHTINLQNNSFYGGVPLAVGRLFRLRIFGLSNYSFTGEIPSNLSRCSNLQVFSIGYNKLSGIIPKELSSLQKLETLHLCENNLIGTIPDSLGNLSSLQLLNLSDNNLNGRIPNSLGQLKSLQGLGLGSNRLSSTFPPSIYNISSLQILSLPLNQIIGKLPSDVGLALHNLRVNSFVGQLPANMGSMPNLQWLRLEANRLGSSAGTHRAEDSKFLSSIVDSSSNLQNSNAGEITSTLSKCSSLQQLSLRGNFFHGSIPPSFSSLQGHQGLDLSLNNLSGEIPTFLQNLLSSLQYLDLPFNKGAMPTEGLFKNASAFSILGNNKLCGGILELQLPLCPDHIQKHSNKKHQISLHLKVAIGVIVSTISCSLFCEKAKKWD